MSMSFFLGKKKPDFRPVKLNREASRLEDVGQQYMVALSPNEVMGGIYRNSQVKQNVFLDM